MTGWAVLTTDSRLAPRLFYLCKPVYHPGITVLWTLVANKVHPTQIPPPPARGPPGRRVGFKSLTKLILASWQ